MKIVILERNSVGADVSVSKLDKYGEVTAYANTQILDIAERVKDTEIIIANKSPLNELTLMEADKVKLICEFATGYDNVDLEYCKSRGIGVCNVVNYCSDAVAQHTIAMTLYLLEKMEHYDRYVKSGQYAMQDRFSNFDLPFCELAGKTWGIIGMGNIGQKVAQVATVFGCKVITHSVSGKSTCKEYEQVDFDTLLSKSDVLSLHCPLTDLTRNLIDEKALSRMKKTAILINVARGAVVDQDALYDALVSGQIAGAGLDVLKNEPIVRENPLSKIQDSGRLIITPHLAWASIEARERCVDETCKNIEAFLGGKERNRVV